LGAVKQEIEVGSSNRNEVMIISGLDQDDQVFLNRVSGMEKSDVALLPSLNGKRSKKAAAEEVKPAAMDSARVAPAGGRMNRERNAQ
jgi:hypothetical protein